MHLHCHSCSNTPPVCSIFLIISHAPSLTQLPHQICCMLHIPNLHFHTPVESALICRHIHRSLEFLFRNILSTLNKNPTDATVCRYLFTAKLLYMFRVSQHPSSGVSKTITAASGTGHNNGTITPLQRGLKGTT